MNILFISLGCDKNLVDSEVMLGLVTACTALPPHFLFERAVTSCGGFAFFS